MPPPCPPRGQGRLRASDSVFVACVRLIRGDITGGQGEPEDVAGGEEGGGVDGMGGGRVALVLGPLQNPEIEAASGQFASVSW